MEPDFYVPIVILVLGGAMGLLISWETIFGWQDIVKTGRDGRSKQVTVMRPKPIGIPAIVGSVVLIGFGVWQLLLANDKERKADQQAETARAEAKVEAEARHTEVLGSLKKANGELTAKVGQLEPKLEDANREAKRLGDDNQEMKGQLVKILAATDQSKSFEEIKAAIQMILNSEKSQPEVGVGEGKPPARSFPPEVVGHLLFPANVKPLFRSLNAPDPGPYPQWLFIPRSENSAYRLVPGAENYWVDLGVKGPHHVMELRALPGKTVANRSIVVELATARPNGQIAYSPATLGFDGHPEGSVYEFPDEGKAVEVRE